MKSRLVVGLLLGCLVAAAGCSSSSSSTASPATTGASPTATSTAKNFQVSTPNGQVSLSLDGQLPPNWPSQFPVPAGAKAAGSGSLGGSSSATLVAAYTTSESASDAFAFYKDNSKLTTSDQKSVGTGAHYVGTGEDHRTLHGLRHRGLSQRHHLHRHRADELSSFFSFRFPYRQLAHDLRHAGSTLTAEAGVSLRVLMERMGHSSIRAASGPRSLTLPAVRKRCGRVNDCLEDFMPLSWRPRMGETWGCAAR